MQETLLDLCQGTDTHLNDIDIARLSLLLRNHPPTTDPYLQKLVRDILPQVVTVPDDFERRDYSNKEVAQIIAGTDRHPPIYAFGPLRKSPISALSYAAPPTNGTTMHELFTSCISSSEPVTHIVRTTTSTNLSHKKLDFNTLSCSSCEMYLENYSVRSTLEWKADNILKTQVHITSYDSDYKTHTLTIYTIVLHSYESFTLTPANIDRFSELHNDTQACSAKTVILGAQHTGHAAQLMGIFVLLEQFDEVFFKHTPLAHFDDYFYQNIALILLHMRDVLYQIGSRYFNSTKQVETMVLNALALKIQHLNEQLPEELNAIITPTNIDRSSFSATIYLIGRCVEKLRQTPPVETIECRA